MKRVWTWIGILLVGIFGIPILIIFGGGLYSPLLLENVQASAGLSQGEANAQEHTTEIIEILANIVPHTQHIETIKAHAVIVRTYMARREQGIIQQGVLPRMEYAQMKKVFGEEFEDVYRIYKEAVEATQNEVIFYDGEVIEPVYHKESAGYTRDGISLYNMDIPYLKSVDSPGDTVTEEKVILKSEFISKLETAYPEIMIDHSAIEHQIQVIEKDASGYIDSLQIGNLLIEAEELKELIGLKSTCFTLKSIDDIFVFEVKGIGHGVGLSQKGANAMAEEGKDYTEIIEYYYNGIEIKNNKKSE